tara:strand:- start:56 stop:646 length:591 start_codon:yes stop_codon:yes gene_type:complete
MIMKTTHLKLVFVSLFTAMLICSCKNENKKDAVTNAAESSTPSADSHESGQAFIADESSTPNVLQIAIGSSDHSTLVAAVQAASLENVLVNAGPLTVFAPTNAAFDALPAGTVENLLKPENKAALANILKHHVSAGNYTKDFLKNFKKLGQANDQSTTVEVKGDDVFIGGAKIIASIPAGNGIVHVVDKVILPSTE